jgi:hypothetical protein
MHPSGVAERLYRFVIFVTKSKPRIKFHIVGLMHGLINYIDTYHIKKFTCFICRTSDSTVSEDAGIKPSVVTTLVVTARRSARSHPLSARSHPYRLDLIHIQLDLIHTRLNLIQIRLDLTHTRLDLIHIRLDLIHIRLYLIHNRLDLIHTRRDLIHMSLTLRRYL